MSNDFGTNPRRVDIVLNSNSKYAHKTWGQVLKAVRAGDTLIYCSIPYVRKENTYDTQGRCTTVGVYSNMFCNKLRLFGITDIRYGSMGYPIPNSREGYTLYKSKRN